MFIGDINVAPLVLSKLCRPITFDAKKIKLKLQNHEVSPFNVFYSGNFYRVFYNLSDPEQDPLTRTLKGSPVSRRRIVSCARHCRRMITSSNNDFCAQHKWRRSSVRKQDRIALKFLKHLCPIKQFKFIIQVIRIRCNLNSGLSCWLDWVSTRNLPNLSETFSAVM